MEGPASAGPITNLKFKLLVNYKQTKMKKVIAIFAVAAVLTACGGNGKSEATTDSTAVAVDSTVVAADTVAVDSASVVK